MLSDRMGLLPTLEIDVLRTFVAICESGNFSKAADRVGRTPSAVSLQVKKLEETLGRELFLREPRSTVQTVDGEMLLSFARRLIRLNDETVSRFLAPRLDGKVSFGAPNDSGIFAIPGFLKRFASTHPDVDVDVVLDTSRALRRRCEKGDLDLVLFAGGGLSTESGSGINGFGEDDASGCELVLVEDLVWVGLRQGQASTRRPLPLALADAGCCWRAAAVAALDKAEISFRIAYSSEHCQGQIAAVEADLAIAPLPRSVACGAFVRLGSECGLPPLGDYSVFLKKRENAGAVADALAAHVAESFREKAGLGLRLFA